MNASEPEKNSSKQWPIVYCSKYNVKFYGLEKFHPFDASKWENIIQVFFFLFYMSN